VLKRCLLFVTLLQGHVFKGFKGNLGIYPALQVVLGKSLNFGILPDTNPNLAFNWIHENLDPDPGTLEFVLDHLGFVTL
jgi:hypothetical protein